MRIAISAEENNGMNSTVCGHFGGAPYFVLADVTDGKVDHVEAVSNPGFPNHKPGQVPQFIRDQGANVVVTGGIGQRAIALLGEYGIQVAGGATGTAAQALEAFLAGALSGIDPCTQGEHHHHHGDHTCEDHEHHGNQ